MFHHGRRRVYCRFAFISLLLSLPATCRFGEPDTKAAACFSARAASLIGQASRDDKGRQLLDASSMTRRYHYCRHRHYSRTRLPFRYTLEHFLAGSPTFEIARCALCCVGQLNGYSRRSLPIGGYDDARDISTRHVALSMGHAATI